MPALNAPGTTAAAADMDVELAVNRLAGDLDLVLLLDIGFLDGTATVRADIGQRGFVDLINLCRRQRRSMAFAAVVLARLATGLFGLWLGWPLGEGRGLALAGAPGFSELGLEFGDAPPKGFTGGTGRVHTDSVASRPGLSCASPLPDALNND